MRRNFVRWMAVSALAAVVILAASGPVQAAGNITLRLNLKEGQTYPLRMLMSQKITQTMQNQPMSIDQLVGFGFSLAVEKVEADGAMDVALTYDWVRVKSDMTMGGQKMSTEYDSAHPPATPSMQTQMFAVLVGMGFKMTLNPDGTVKAISGLDEMMDQMIAKMNMPAAQTAQVKASLQQQFGEKNMKENMSQMFANFPAQPVGIGDSWNTTMTTSIMNADLTINSTHTLKAVNGDLATIATVSTITSNKQAPAAGVTAPQESVEMSGKMEGTTDVNLTTGWTESGHATQNLSGKMDMGEGQAMTMTMVGDMTLQPKDVQ